MATVKRPRIVLDDDIADPYADLSDLAVPAEEPEEDDSDEENEKQV